MLLVIPTVICTKILLHCLSLNSRDMEPIVMLFNVLQYKSIAILHSNVLFCTILSCKVALKATIVIYQLVSEVKRYNISLNQSQVFILSIVVVLSTHTYPALEFLYSSNHASPSRLSSLSESTKVGWFIGIVYWFGMVLDF